jgi:hypothetical protein
MTSPLKTAVLLTGAAARISQEVALFDRLRVHSGLIVNQDETLLAGFSSGSLNLAAINACFRDTDPLDWENYYKKGLLFPLTNEDVYKITRLPLDTSPLRGTLQNFLDTMNCHKVGDLAFYSYILTFAYGAPWETLWACSQDNMQYHLNLTDMFMASTAIPLIFPSQEIHCEHGYKTDFPDGRFADGGTGGTFKRFGDYLGEFVSQNDPFENMFIISPMRQSAEDEKAAIVNFLHEDDKSKGLITELNNIFENISMRGFVRFLKLLNKARYNGKPIAENIYVSIPFMTENYPIMNFDLQEDQYNAVDAWVSGNLEKLAIPIDEFLKEYGDEIA